MEEDYYCEDSLGWWESLQELIKEPEQQSEEENN